MKIEINLYDETGTRIVGKALETDCQSLIVNGIHLIQGGGIHAEMRRLHVEETEIYVDDLRPPLELN